MQPDIPIPFSSKNVVPSEGEVLGALHHKGRETADRWVGPTAIGLTLGLPYVAASSRVVPVLKRLVAKGTVERHPTRKGQYRVRIEEVSDPCPAHPHQGLAPTGLASGEKVCPEDGGHLIPPTTEAVPEPRTCGLCGVRLVPDGSRYCSQAHREEAKALGDDDAFSLEDERCNGCKPEGTVVHYGSCPLGDEEKERRRLLRASTLGEKA